ncbi:hypothetical protein NHX12_021462 [Muraenolepis orangiensis]|uniref:Uncharacterized protein n=1 Tax=Muraenolepis orangiensis TaxID=630683 RepID=A0A9Q0EVJ4_9TELE|nr:hypothetical protein NHX12_021462 [Muraenolepis orangiensis]
MSLTTNVSIPCSPSLHKALRDEPPGKTSQDHESASPGASLEESGALPPSEKTSLPVNKEEFSDYVSSTTTHTFSCEFRLDRDDGSLEPVSKLKSTSVDSTKGRTSNCTERQTLDQCAEFTKPNKAMLSSAMVSVLAPHWSKRNQRTKKGISTEDFEAQNVPRGPHTGAQTVHSRFLEPHRHFREEIVLRDRPQLAGPIRKIEGWSSRSGPSSINLNSSTKRLTPFTASFDMGSHSLDNGDTEGCHSNPQEKTPPPIPSLSLVQCPNERMPPTGQGQVAQPSSKPITSSLLLSLRKIAPEIEDNVFYSPKELTPPGVSALEMGRSVSPLGTARRHMSTGPAIGGPSHACADLKYGIDAGRSISVSSVVSSRRLGSERISTGSRVLSMDDLLNGAHQSKYKCQSMGDQGYDTNYRLSSGPTEMRSRSLPRSLTRSLSCWSSEGSPPKKQSPTATPHDRLSGPSSRGTDHFHYLEGVLTPPPSPLSPAARQMSRPPRRSSPGSPGTPGDSESVRGMLSTRGLIASLSDFNESSSSDSESTTDDEYYLIPAEDDDKESAL